MTIDELIIAVHPSFNEMKLSKKRQCRHEVNVELQRLFKISQPAVSKWGKNGIPADRAIEIVKHYKLDPSCLL